MYYPLDIEGFDGHKIMVESHGFVRQPMIFYDGRPAKRGENKGQYILQRNDGFKVTVQVNGRPFDVVPKVIVDGKQIYVAESLRFYQVIWSAAPLALLFVGGLVGGFIGAFAFWMNLKAFRSDIHPLEKYILSGSISLIAFIATLGFLFVVSTLVVNSLS